MADCETCGIRATAGKCWSAAGCPLVSIRVRCRPKEAPITAQTLIGGSGLRARDWVECGAAKVFANPGHNRLHRVDPFELTAVSKLFG